MSKSKGTTMKNTKKYVLGLLALLIGVGTQTSLSQIKIRVLPAHKAKQRAAFAVRSAKVLVTNY